MRDSFTIPASEYAALSQLKQRAVALARPAKKSEVLRAGLMALAALDDRALLAALARVPAVKTGRPKARRGAADEAPVAAPPKSRKNASRKA